MGPKLDNLDEHDEHYREIRGHLAISIKERIDRGEDPESARRAALKEFGNVAITRESMQRIWRHRWADMITGFAQDVRVAVRSLRRAKGLTATVVFTLALGIGANAAVFSVVRHVLLRPLVNDDEERLIYVRQTAPGIGVENMTWSVPELDDLRSRVTSLNAFGDFSTVEFTMIGLGLEPRVVRAGVVGGSFFDVMGLRPVLGRLLNATDDGPEAPGAAVLTHRFWTTSLASDPSVVGKTVRLGPRSATVVGVLEPSVPYPAETEIIANVVTSPHHLGALMVTGRTHRMTELFGRLAPGATLDAARAELSTVHDAMKQKSPEAYSLKADVRVTATRLRDQIASPARTVLLVLLAAAALVFVIACSNVANLILARSVRRESELTVRAALGATNGALRRTLLAESVVLCGGGALLGVLLAGPLLTLLARFAARFSVRALDVTVDTSLLWTGVGLAAAAAVLLAFVPRLPAAGAASGPGLTSGGVRLTHATNRRLKAFAMAQVSLSFVLLAAAGMLLTTLIALQTASSVVNLRQVLAIDVPPSATGTGGGAEVLRFYQQATERIGQLPGVTGVSIGNVVPWRDRTSGFKFGFAAEGYQPANGEDNPTAGLRLAAPNLFAVLGVPVLAGRDFNDEDRIGSEPVAIVSQTVAQRLFPNGDALNRRVWWTDPLFGNPGKPVPRRIVGVVADIDDEHVVQGPALTIYHPLRQMGGGGGRLFIHATGDPYALVPAVTKVIRDLAPEQPVERASTLGDVRAEVLAPERLNTFVFAGFAGVALLIAVVGVAGVLAFSVSARTREFGVRLAVGSTPGDLLTRVLSEGALIAVAGIVAGAAGGYALARTAAAFVPTVSLPGVVAAVGAAVVLVGAAVVASLMPAWRASRVDVVQALRSE